MNAKETVAEETVTITKTSYDKLLDREQWLCCLEAAGVNNWCG